MAVKNAHKILIKRHISVGMMSQSEKDQYYLKTGKDVVHSNIKTKNIQSNNFI